MDGELEEDSKGDFRGDFKQDIEGDLLSSSGQVKSRSGLVQVWFSLQLKFYSFELDSEVGRLVVFVVGEMKKQHSLRNWLRLKLRSCLVSIFSYSDFLDLYFA